MERSDFVSAGTLSQGQLISKRFKITDCIGSGAMGCVYLAEDAHMNNHLCALKVLHPQFTADQSLVKRFLREVHLIHSIDHPNVVRTHHIGSHEGLLYYSMEYVPGVVLDKFKGLAHLSIDRLTDIIIQICDGISAIHKAGVIHRDFKPGNILILPDYRVKIVDFGVARPLSSKLTQHEEIMGSLEYIAPEIWKGEDVAPHTDLYSLGVMLYQVVTGVTPFGEDSIARIMWKHVHEKPTAPNKAKANIPEWINDLIMWLLEKDPKARPSSAEEVKNYINVHTGNSPEKVISLFSSESHISFDANKVVEFPLTANQANGKSTQDASPKLKLITPKYEQIKSPSHDLPAKKNVLQVAAFHHGKRRARAQRSITALLLASIALLLFIIAPQMPFDTSLFAIAQGNKTKSAVSLQTQEPWSVDKEVAAIRDIAKKAVSSSQVNIPAIREYLTEDSKPKTQISLDLNHNPIAESIKRLSEKHSIVTRLLEGQNAAALMNTRVSDVFSKRNTAHREKQLLIYKLSAIEGILNRISSNTFSVENFQVELYNSLAALSSARESVSEELKLAEGELAKLQEQIQLLDETETLLLSKELANYNPRIRDAVIRFKAIIDELARINKLGKNQQLPLAKLSREYQRLIILTSESLESKLMASSSNVRMISMLKDSIDTQINEANERQALLEKLTGSQEAISILSSHLQKQHNQLKSQLAVLEKIQSNPII